MRKINLILFLAGVGIALLALGGLAEDKANMAHAEYCEMVQLNKDTNGKLGWPDYNQNFEDVCK